MGDVIGNAAWQIVDTVEFSGGIRVANLPQDFADEFLIFIASSAASPPYWYKAGYVQQEYQISGFPKAYAVSELLGLQTQIVRFNVDLVPFKVSLVRVPWLPDLKVQVFRPV
jgi:hypothetical protein